jgi:hypothetical protein
MQHLRACRKATTKRPAAAARHAYRARRGGALRLAFVNESTLVLHATLEPIAGSQMHWMPFGMQKAIGADVKELSSFRVGLRCYMHVLSCTTALLR